MLLITRLKTFSGFCRRQHRSPNAARDSRDAVYWFPVVHDSMYGFLILTTHDACRCPVLTTHNAVYGYPVVAKHSAYGL